MNSLLSRLLFAGCLLLAFSSSAQSSTSPDERAVAQLVRDFLAAEQAYDPAALARLTDEHYVEVSPRGEVDERVRFLGFYQPEQRKPWPPLTVSEEQIRVLGPTALDVLRLTYTLPGPDGTSRTQALRATFAAQRGATRRDGLAPGGRAIHGHRAQCAARRPGQMMAGPRPKAGRIRSLRRQLLLPQILLMAVVAPSTVFPLANHERLCFLKNMVNHPQITVGDYTYYDDFETVENFQRNVRYLFDFTGDKLIIGKFCMIASGVEFIMNGANHLANAVSAYPFAIFGGDWADAMAGKSYPTKGNTTVGNDVWIGYRATILPGVTIGDGAIIGAYSVVTRDVAPYTIVGGNPAALLRPRFDPATTAQLLRVAWWDWPLEKITRHTPLLTGNAAAFLAAVRQEAREES